MRECGRGKRRKKLGTERGGDGEKKKGEGQKRKTKNRDRGRSEPGGGHEKNEGSDGDKQNQGKILVPRALTTTVFVLNGEDERKKNRFSFLFFFSQGKKGWLYLMTD